MAIHTAVAQRVAGWFTTEKREEERVGLPTTQRTSENKQAIMKASPDEDEEVLRLRKAKMDLMKVQTIRRGY